MWKHKKYCQPHLLYLKTQRINETNHKDYVIVDQRDCEEKEQKIRL